MEMVLDCRPALWAFENTLSKEMTMEMLRPSGGPLIAHFWMALRTLIRIVDVLNGDGLADAEAWVDRMPRLTVGGYPEAAAHYEALHSRPQRVPALLELYQHAQADKFAALYLKAVSGVREKERLNYEAADLIFAVRTAFDEFGKWFYDKNVRNRRCLGISLRLYSRLPTYKPRTEGSFFYPASTLPCKEIMKKLLDRWSGPWSVPDQGDSLALLEVLLQRGQLVWTIGAQGNTQACNWANWYTRARGLHQIVLRLCNHHELGPHEARLSEALAILEDPRLIISIRCVHEAFQSGASIRSAIDDFCARKSGKHHYPGMKILIEHSESDYGTEQEVLDHFGKARIAVKQAIVIAGDAITGQAQSPQHHVGLIEEVLEQHSVLGLIDTSHWELAFPTWYLGWRDANAKRLGTAGAGLGWALIDAWFAGVRIPELLRTKPARWALHVASRVLTLTGEEVWWDGQFSLNDLPKIPVPLPAYLDLGHKPKGDEVEDAKPRKKRQGDDNGTNPQAVDSNKPTKKRTSRLNAKPSGDSTAPGPVADNHTIAEAGNATNIDTNRKEGTNPSSSRITANQGNVRPIDWSTDNFSDYEHHFLQREHMGNDVKNVAPPKGLAFHHRSLAAATPAHVIAPPIGTTTVAHHCWRQLAEIQENLTPPKDLKKRINHTIADTLKLTAKELGPALNELSDARNKLRMDLISLGDFVQESKLSHDMALILLPDMSAGLKDIFLVQCTKIFISHFSMNIEEAVHEAASMAASDGLLDAELFTLRPNRMVLDLMTTFPRPAQTSLLRRQTEYFWTNHHDTVRDNAEDALTMRILQYIVPARGLGRTESESRERALQAVEHQMVAHEPAHSTPWAVAGRAIVSERSSTPPILHERDRNPSEDILKKRLDEWRLVLPTLVKAGGTDSAFSTGKFLPEDEAIYTSLEGKLPPKILEKAQRHQHKYDQVWEEAIHSDINKYLEWRDTSEQNSDHGDTPPYTASTVLDPLPSNIVGSTPAPAGASTTVRPKFPEESSNGQRSGSSSVQQMNNPTMDNKVLQQTRIGPVPTSSLSLGGTQGNPAPSQVPSPTILVRATPGQKFTSHSSVDDSFLPPNQEHAKAKAASKATREPSSSSDSSPSDGSSEEGSKFSDYPTESEEEAGRSKRKEPKKSKPKKPKTKNVGH
ncbi:hypothetical protein FRC08_004528 [Ceratobasidium sp. 394]|nr:hypothetical protein FRC08_004528 [Ceratobasidium sp. 394]